MCLKRVKTIIKNIKRNIKAEENTSGLFFIFLLKNNIYYGKIKMR